MFPNPPFKISHIWFTLRVGYEQMGLIAPRPRAQPTRALSLPDTGAQMGMNEPGQGLWDEAEEPGHSQHQDVGRHQEDPSGRNFPHQVRLNWGFQGSIPALTEQC